MTNKISVTGALGKDAELKYTKSGAPVLEFSVADSLRKEDNGAWVDARDVIWWRVSLWNQFAEALAPLLTKGTRVEVSGPIQIRTYSKVDGSQGVSYEIRADTVGPAARHGAASAAPSPQFGNSAAQTAFDQYNAAAADPNSWAGGDDAPPF